MTSDASGKLERWTLTLCGLQVAAACLAAGLALWQIESILATGPVMAILGWVITWHAQRKSSLGLVLFGLHCPLVTSLIAMLIAIFHWQPQEAAAPVGFLLAGNAILTTLWGGWIALESSRAEPAVADPRGTGFQFSMARLLGVMTVVCFLAALLRNVRPESDWVLFAAYGVATLVLSASIWVWFEYRVRRVRREST